MANTFEQSARTTKAFKLANVFTAVVHDFAECSGTKEVVTAEALVEMAERSSLALRRHVAASHGINEPSEATWAVVVAILRQRAQPPADPFEGLPR